MTLTVQQITDRLEQIDSDLQERQTPGEEKAEAYYRAKRDFELDYAIKFMNATGSATERKQKALKAMEKEASYLALLEAEGGYEGWKAAVRVLETRASIGQSLLRHQREMGG